MGTKIALKQENKAFRAGGSIHVLFGAKPLE